MEPATVRKTVFVDPFVSKTEETLTFRWLRPIFGMSISL